MLLVVPTRRQLHCTGVEKSCKVCWLGPSSAPSPGTLAGARGEVELELVALCHGQMLSSLHPTPSPRTLTLCSVFKSAHTGRAVPCPRGPPPAGRPCLSLSKAACWWLPPFLVRVFTCVSVRATWFKRCMRSECWGRAPCVAQGGVLRSGTGFWEGWGSSMPS